MYETTWTAEGDWCITLPADITEEEFMSLEVPVRPTMEQTR